MRRWSRWGASVCVVVASAGACSRGGSTVALVPAATEPAPEPEPEPNGAVREAPTSRPVSAEDEDAIVSVVVTRDGLTLPPQAPGDPTALRDVTVAALSALPPRWEVRCDAFAGEPCPLRGDFDGDGRPDAAYKIRESSTRHAGIAIAWAPGDVSLIAADSGTAVIDVDFDFVDGFDHPPEYELSWNYGLADLSFLEGWRVASDLTQPRLGADDPGRIPVPAAVGDGIAFHGRILFYDGLGWRLIVMV